MRRIRSLTPIQHLSAVASALLIGSAGLQAQAPAAPNPAPAPELPKKPSWETSAALGLTLTRGNSDTLLFTGSLLTAKKWDQNEVNLGADATYGEVNSVKNAESVHGFGQYNRLFTDRAFGYLRFDGLRDSIADVDYRFTLSPGVGYYFIKDKRTTLRAEFGPGVIFEKQGGRENNYMILRFAERFEHKLNDRAKIWQSFEFLPQIDRWKNYIINAEIGVETSLTEKMSLRTFLQDTYDNEPAAGRKKNDLKLVAGVAYKF